MKKAIQTIKKLSKVDAVEIKAVINLDLKAGNFKEQESEFYEILDKIDSGLKAEPFTWSRYDNQANINKNISITFTF